MRALKIPVAGRGRPRVRLSGTEEAEALSTRIREVVRQVAPTVPNIDPHDLRLIIERRLRIAQWDQRQKFFIRKTPGGYYVF